MKYDLENDREWQLLLNEPWVPVTEEEFGELLMLATYQEEIERKKLAAQLVMTLGDDVSDDTLVSILRGEYQSIVVSEEHLQNGYAEYDECSVLMANGQIRLSVPRKDDRTVTVFADFGAPDGRLTVVAEAYRTVENFVFELDMGPGTELRIYIHMEQTASEAETQYGYSH